MSEPSMNPYEVLGLAQSSSAEELKRAYFVQVRANPPQSTPEQFKRIRAAYECLRDPAQRFEVDMLLIQPWPAPTRRKRPPKLALGLRPVDVLVALRVMTALDRTDWREQHEKVQF